ncbi:MAG: RNA-binding S4 domain-containing protein [Bacteroidales bacterium]|jgi:ribosome-associated heat shock protein Hsp15|nr:RNA-binding S4 domain-containing protein [Bacteroidales bacterium]
MIPQRIDKYLWTIRLFKTRTQAQDACKGGRVKIAGVAVKPAHDVRQNEIIDLSMGSFIKTIKVLDTSNNRVGTPKVSFLMEDLTPIEMIEQAKTIRQTNHEFRDRGLGRPTKKDRRDIEALKRWL